MNFVVSNTVKRVLHILREACNKLRIEQELTPLPNKNRLEGMLGFEPV